MWCREAIRLSWKHKVTDRLQHCGGFAAAAFRTKKIIPPKETKKPKLDSKSKQIKQASK